MLSGTIVSSRELFPVLLVQLIRDFKFDMSHFEKVLLHINIQVPYVPK